MLKTMIKSPLISMVYQMAGSDGGGVVMGGGGISSTMARFTRRPLESYFNQRPGLVLLLLNK